MNIFSSFDFKYFIAFHIRNEEKYNRKREELKTKTIEIKVK